MDLRAGLFVLILAPEAYMPLRQLGAGFHAAEEGLGAADQVFRIVEAGVVEAGPGAVVPDLRGAELRVEGVTVRHAGRSLEAPSGTSFVVRPGEVVAIAGPSGAGKSTLIDVVLGLRWADAGSVVLAAANGDCAPIPSLDLEDWHRHVAWVPQHPFLFAGSIAANIGLATPDASIAAVAAALAAVGLSDLDPLAYLAEGGAGISSGQRRRLGVARALLKGGDFLILDEPTAGLDAVSEATVLAAIRAAARTQGRAVLLAAHRRAALDIADRVVEIESRLEAPQ
jgi:ATP-binding cassette subfamily C protein CydCD